MADNQNLTGVTDAVRAYRDNASEEERNKKSNQQKWGLFETNYQREKGKTLDESLQEIDNFGQHGILPSEMNTVGRGGGAAGGAAGGGGGSSGGASGGEGARFGGAAGGAPAAAGGEVAGGGGGARFGGTASAGGPQGNPQKFQGGTDAGAAFLAQYQQKEAAKYKPGYNKDVSQLP